MRVHGICSIYAAYRAAPAVWDQKPWNLGIPDDARPPTAKKVGETRQPDPDGGDEAAKPQRERAESGLYRVRKGLGCDGLGPFRGKGLGSLGLKKFRMLRG